MSASNGKIEEGDEIRHGLNAALTEHLNRAGSTARRVAAACVRDSQRPKSVRPSNGLLNVLIVEDDPQLTRIYAVTFRGRANIAVAGTLAAGRVAAESPRWDRIVIDLRLPDGSGAELARELREQGRTVPIFVVSGLTSVEVRREVENISDITVLNKLEDISKPVLAAAVAG